ncbi:MAG: hypothetical protein JWM59_2507 [Verrucomicrobiales bacterium]|nr:hypothetical protein [Verrucomicrobiales bacterium]
MTIPDSDLDLFLVHYLDGTLDSRELERLIAELEGNAGARRKLRSMAEQAVAVAEAGRCGEARQPTAPTTRLVALLPDAIGGGRDWRIPWRRLAILAAGLMMLASVGWWVSGKQSRQMEITQVRGAVSWNGQQGRTRQEPAAGLKFKEGTLELIGDDPLVSVRMDDGSTITLHGESEAFFSYENGWIVRLRRGSFEAAVQPQPADRPMRVLTPTAELVVVGTIFSLLAQPDETSLEVVEGLVTMRRLADGRKASVRGQNRLVITLDHQTTLAPRQLVAPPTTWEADFSIFPRNADGTWVPPGKDAPSGALSARPYIAGRREDGGVLVHHGILYRHHQALATVQAGAELRLKVRTTSDTSLQIMAVTYRPEGGYGGNYEINAVPCLRPPDGGWREVNIPLQMLRQNSPVTTALPPGNVIVAILINSYTWSVGLEIGGLAIRPPQ